jgi:hypothetical protein
MLFVDDNGVSERQAFYGSDRFATSGALLSRNGRKFVIQMPHDILD